MLALKHISSRLTSSRSLIFQLLAMLDPEQSPALLTSITMCIRTFQCCNLKPKPAKCQPYLRSAQRPQLSEKHFVFCQNFSLSLLPQIVSEQFSFSTFSCKPNYSQYSLLSQCHGEEHLPLDPASQSPLHPGLEYFQEWGTHPQLFWSTWAHFYHPPCKKITLMSTLNYPLSV